MSPFRSSIIATRGVRLVLGVLAVCFSVLLTPVQAISPGVRHPTNEEQYTLQLINRARASADGSSILQGLVTNNLQGITASTTGEALFWLMNGTNYSGWSSMGVLINPSGFTELVDWRVAGRGDFDLDGKSDIILLNSRTGETFFWLMNGLSYKGGSGMGVLINQNGVTALPLEWRVAGTGDFDLDGKLDIILQNDRTGEALFWLMNGTTYKGWSGMGVLISPSGYTALGEWRVAGTGDFDLDGKPDIILQNNRTGEAFFWLMNGLSYKGGSGLGVLVNQNGVSELGELRVSGTGDFDLDGKPDIILQNNRTGESFFLLMNGLSSKGGSGMGVLINQNGVTELPVEWIMK
jgi:hypothetical protein